ncbi:hypothetical protein Anapl_10564 [Anas platyrhynchos]|uniref:Uncharacterized protein n=1 Tax=Anas platyrhynchos TaxID=8839 RepID=R0JKG0_ANAPL|nr:hypothetical protein Anapl_10564 [Anas platyrhynchos]
MSLVQLQQKQEKYLGESTGGRKKQSQLCPLEKILLIPHPQVPTGATVIDLPGKIYTSSSERDAEEHITKEEQRAQTARQRREDMQVAFTPTASRNQRQAFGLSHVPRSLYKECKEASSPQQVVKLRMHPPLESLLFHYKG